MKILHRLTLCFLYIGFIVLIISCDTADKDWQKVKSSNSIAEYQKFLQSHPGSNFEKVTRQSIDSLEWLNAILADDSRKILLLLRKLDLNHNIQKVNSLEIYSLGKGHYYGKFKGCMWTDDGNLEYFGGGPVTIRIYKDIINRKIEEIKEYNAQTGYACIFNGNSLVGKRKIDLSKTDEEICKLFDVPYGIYSEEDMY